MGGRAGGGARGGGGGGWSYQLKETKQSIETLRKNQGSIYAVSDIGEAYKLGSEPLYSITAFYGNKQSATLSSTNRKHVAGWRKEINKTIKANKK